MPEQGRSRWSASRLGLICALAAALGAGPANAEALFPGQKFPVAQGFVDPLAVADLDGDGVPDLVTTESVLLGNGDGSFQPALPLSAPEAAGPALAVAVADLDGDGIPDLVIADRGLRPPPCPLIPPECPTAGPGAVRILLGNGDGSFEPALSFAVEPDPRSLTLADLDGDGVPDLVTAHGAPLPPRRPVCACEPPGTLSVRLGQGAGSFAPPLFLEVGSEPGSVAVADLDGDRIPDLVTANGSPPLSNRCAACPRTLSVLLGTGGGSFGPAHSFDLGRRPLSVAVADLDADGIPDLLTANAREIFDPLDPSLRDDVSVLLGRGDGSFGPASSFSAGSPVVVADLDDDDVPDLVSSNGGGYPGLRGSALVFLGRGDGSFRPVSSFPAGRPAAVADLDGDDVPDLVTAHSGFPSPGGAVSAFLGHGDGTFQAGRSLAVGVAPVSVSAADLDDNGIPDLVTANDGSLEPGTLSALMGRGDGSFETALSFPAGLEPADLAVADLDGDRVPDLVTAGVSSRGFIPVVQALLGHGDGTFQTPLPSPTDREPASLAAADLDDDGVPDLVTANSSSDDVSVLLGNGDGSFQLPRSFATGPLPAAVAVADLDGDHIPDLVTANLSHQVGVLLGRGDGSFQAALSFPTGQASASVAVADLDGDRVPDLVTANRESDDVSVLLGNGDGTFRAAVAFPAGFGARSIAVADVDGDGVPDLVTANAGSFAFDGASGDDVSVLLGNGDGSFQPALGFVAGARPISVTVADLDGDRLPDLVTANLDSGDVTVLPNLRQPACPDRRRPPRRGKALGWWKRERDDGDDRGRGRERERRWERDDDDDRPRDRCRPALRRGRR